MDALNNIVWGLFPQNNSQGTNDTHENDQPQDHDDDMPALEPINIPNTQASTTQHSADVQMPATPSRDEDIRGDRDAIEVEIQAVGDSSSATSSGLNQHTNMDGGSDSRPTTQRTSSRRVRMEEDDDDDRDRRHPFHRIFGPDPASMRVNSPSMPSARGNQPTTPTSVPPTTENINPTPPTTAPPPENPNPTRIFGGFAITLDLSSGQPVTIDLSTGHAINGLGPGLHPPLPNNHAGNIVPPGPTQDHIPNPATGLNQNAPQLNPNQIPLPPPPSLPALLARLGALGAVFSNLAEPDTDDPERADRMVRALEAVPEGLVKRLERVGEGEQGGCAVCWEGLGSGLGWGENEDEAQAPGLNESGPSDLPSTPDSPSTTPPPTETEPQPKPKPAPLPKIVALPCAHVFHSSCLIPWFSRPRQTTCPTCRFDIDPEGATYGGGRRSRPTGMGFNTMNLGPTPNLDHLGGVPGFTPISRPPRPGETIPPIPPSQRPQAQTAPRSQVDADAIAALDGEMRLGMGMDIDRENGTADTANVNNQNPIPPAPPAPAPRPRSLLTIGFDIIFTGSPFPPPGAGLPRPPTLPATGNPNPGGFNFGGIFAPRGPAAAQETTGGGQQLDVESIGRLAREELQHNRDGEIHEWRGVTADEELRNLLEHDQSSDEGEDGDIVLEQMIFTDGDPNEHEDHEPENQLPPDASLPQGNGFPFGFGGFPPPEAPFGGTRFASGTGRTMGEAMQQLLGGLNAGRNPDSNPNPPTNPPTNPQGAPATPGAMGAAFLAQLLGGIARFPPSRAAPTPQNPDRPPTEGQRQAAGPTPPTPADFLAHLFGGGVPVAMGAAPMPLHQDGVAHKLERALKPEGQGRRHYGRFPRPQGYIEGKGGEKGTGKGWRCWDACCGFGPSDEEPIPSGEKSNSSGNPPESTESAEIDVPSENPNALNQLAIRNEVSLGAVCGHKFHPACLVTSERIARNGWSPMSQRARSRVRPQEEWEEGVRVLAAMA
ncbi:hypothetical protein BD779DRAFT_1500117 [Infundibulicybe gibba]|nr:hypothetical protein BD779DRAFT_1500117 [Infundibulicybe gibba]